MAATSVTETDQSSLFKFASSNTPGTRVTIKLQPDEKPDDLETRLLFAGFIDITLDQSSSQFTARLPPHASGASVSLSSAPTTSWAAAVANANADDAVIDEDKLLEGDGIPMGPACELPKPGEVTQKRKPCKNCSCGLADMDGNAVEKEENNEENEPKKNMAEEEVIPKKSDCGNCSLGDAFRCASCPYLGLPPFKEGEKITIPTSLMTSDI